MIAGLEKLERFSVEIADHIAVVTMTHPPVNAQDRLFRLEFVRILDVLGAESRVRVIVLTGSGKLFSAGADLREREKILDEPGGYAHHNRLVRSAFDVIIECPKPIIAAMNGGAIGAGAVMALLCDILIVSDSSYIAMTEVDFGLAGGVRHILRAFHPSDARLIVYTAKRISGPELFRMNAASACVSDDKVVDEARTIAASIAEKVPLAVLAAKRAFCLTEEMPLSEGYRYEQTQTALLAETRDTQEAIAAFREKRKPVFEGR